MFSLAESLGMTVATLTETLSVSEMLQWSQYHAAKSEQDEPDWSNPDTVKDVFKL